MTTVNYQVADSADDASEASGIVSLTANPYRISRTSYNISDYISGHRFLGVTIPEDATITSAYLELYTDATQYAPAVSVYGEDGSNPAAFTTGNYDIKNRTKTTAVVLWEAAGGASQWIKSPDIKDIINELIADYDYSDGLNLALLTYNKGITATNCRCVPYDGGYGAKLEINYTVPEGGAGARVQVVFI